MAPNTAVIYTPDDIELDLRQPHLGHPDRPDLLGELFTPGSSRPSARACCSALSAGT